MKDDKKLIWIFVTIAYVILIGVSVLAGIQGWGFLPGFIVIIILEVVVFSIYNAIRKSACPKCGKKFSMKEISRKEISSYATTMDVERKVTNNKGEVIRTYTEAVPATHYTYDCVDECKFCGFRRDVRREATYRD